jgi:hypothetical protein
MPFSDWAKVLLPLSISYGSYLLAREQRRQAQAKELTTALDEWVRPELQESIAQAHKFYVVHGRDLPRFRKAMARLEAFRPIHDEKAEEALKSDKELYQLYRDFKGANEHRRKMLAFWVRFSLRYDAYGLQACAEKSLPVINKAQHFEQWGSLLDWANCIINYSKDDCKWPENEPAVYEWVRKVYIPDREVAMRWHHAVREPWIRTRLKFWQAVLPSAEEHKKHRHNDFRFSEPPG